MARGQKAGAGGVRQNKKRKGGATSKKMFHKKPKPGEAAVAGPATAAEAAPAAGRFAAAKDPAAQHAAAAQAGPTGVPFRLGKGREVQSDLLSANRQVIADLAKVAADSTSAQADADGDEDAGAGAETVAERAERVAHEAAVAEAVVAKAGWAPLAQRLNPQSKSFDAEFKEEWDDGSLSKADKQELNRIDALEVAAAKKSGLIAEAVEDERLGMSVRELRAKVRANERVCSVQPINAPSRAAPGLRQAGALG
jgi:hypothetical protein